MRKVMIWVIGLYQRYWSSWHLPACRFYPSCSQYAIQALARYGPIRGSFLAIWRLLRCHPWCSGGYDPVP